MLQLINRIKTARFLAISAFCAIAFSFSTKPGGEGFEIYLNNKLVMQRFGNEMNKVQTLVLDPAAADAALTIKYHHCGKVGKNRYSTIKNDQDKILKEWRYTDVTYAYGAMDCKVKDIITLQKAGAGQLRLYYASSELPNGRQLATIAVSKESKSKNLTR